MLLYLQGAFYIERQSLLPPGSFYMEGQSLLEMIYPEGRSILLTSPFKKLNLLMCPVTQKNCPRGKVKTKPRQLAINKGSLAKLVTFQ